MIIREASLSDVASLVRMTYEFLTSCADDSTIIWSATNENASIFVKSVILPSIEQHEPIMVAEEDGFVIGLSVACSIGRSSMQLKRKYLFGYFTIVEDRFRGRGIATLLRRAVVNRARTMGYDEIIGSVDCSNISGIRSKDKSGFVKIAETVTLKIEK